MPNHHSIMAKGRDDYFNMQIAIFEDDREFAGTLETLIRQHTHFPTIANTADANALWERTSCSPGPVLYLLDILLDGRAQGLELAERISRMATENLIVFLTAHPAKIMADPFYKTKAFSVILKSNPALEEEIRATITLAKDVLRERCLCICSGRFEDLYIPYASISYIEAVKGTNKLCIHSRDGQYVIRETLARLSQRLPAYFIHCHRSIIVNKRNIRQRDKSRRLLTFFDGASCPYSFGMKGGLNDVE